MSTGTKANTKASIGAAHGAGHGLGVLCGLAAGVWLGAAEAPTKLVNSGVSPYTISLCMVTGVFVARWTVPTLLKGTRSVFADLRANKHLLSSAILAGMLWAVANTLTVFAIRDVGLTIAFPLWNTNSLVGIFWGWLLFGELKGAHGKNVAKVVLGAIAIAGAAVMLGFSTIHGQSEHAHKAVSGVLAAAGASLLWGTMYIPYRKAYLSGMNPLSFVTVFTVGELGTVLALAVGLDPATRMALLHWHAPAARGVLFWLFLGGFVWVVGDLFQQFATKYLGIGRAIPLSNTNQLWGLAWGALVFGELAHASWDQRVLVVAGSVVMICGALAVSTAVASEREHASTDAALERECRRYGLDYTRVLQAYLGHGAGSNQGRGWMDYFVIGGAIAVFVWLALEARKPALEMNYGWVWGLGVVLVLSAGICCWALFREQGSGIRDQ